MGEYVGDMAHANGLESFRRLLKLGYHGTYRKMSEKHPNRYAADFSGRFLDRGRHTLIQMDAMARGMLVRHLPYSHLTA